jgi:predicted amidohydrolase YtcJ
MDAEGYPAGGFQPEQGLTALQALKGMTLWAAIANFQEGQLGSIEVGKAADFTLVDRDLLEVSLEQGRDCLVLGTMIAGEWVYRESKELR